MSTLLIKRATYASIASLSTAAFYYAYTKPKNPQTDNAGMLQSYQATYCVPLSCESCVNDISTALSTLPGISSIILLTFTRSQATQECTDSLRKGIKSTTFSLTSQLLSITGTAPPSAVISTIQSTGRPAILRGSGATNSMCFPPFLFTFPLPPSLNLSSHTPTIESILQSHTDPPPS